MEPNALKVLIYGTWGSKVLVFDEPDFPEVELQVPGGTIEYGEQADVAASREFYEETGLRAADPFKLLGMDDYKFWKNGQCVIHRRHFFHAELGGELPETWTHYEQSPFGGGPPILFRFLWLDIPEAVAKLGYGMEAKLPLLTSLTT
ncbi:MULTISPECIES: NUDIX hydrolase [unclassified Rhizobium]|uniref:NUDIX hydrolase n=1 Tax=unclassified Rhizobium TaxID=2613769 RepID=UPI001AD9C4F4|nr:MULTISPECIES: NUDIX domain-containing protein [unclassified Rhizobium]MBO9097584.1 NUDIX domain-containing protein [Rhizobium sp. L58/93]MBO9133011.1 NUDIX domain-containing protein [Rhizobium sp. B209b/85]MBO9168450.1 NUDIX domain-containing protein [Rhizobium sp. L245/93]MBO9183783.1 NUDIX domain-containing protein [Rhizobium sp. E27B/91]QXZ84591.1 NUDIX domain-containing protein [Rhizobium sp. K1/93]